MCEDPTQKEFRPGSGGNFRGADQALSEAQNVESFPGCDSFEDQNNSEQGLSKKGG